MVHDASGSIAARYGLLGEKRTPRRSVLFPMIIGLVVLEGWVCPAGKQAPGRDRTIREIASLIVGGIAQQHGRGDQDPAAPMAVLSPQQRTDRTAMRTR